MMKCINNWSRYSDVKVSPAVVKPCENVTVTVTVHNTGSLDGSEVSSQQA